MDSNAALASSVGFPDANRQSIEKCSSSGGIWKIPSIGKKIYGTIQYGANGCVKSQKVTLSSNADSSGGPCNPESGYTDSGLTVALSGSGGLTFAGSNLRASLASRLLQEAVSYTIFLVDQKGKTLYEQYVGAPEQGSLTFSSPFQGGMHWPADDELGVLVCHQ